ncbi:MAG: 4a-hydroxytetrahydrobiopterin dehydratase [Bacteroidota bacterium]
MAALPLSPEAVASKVANLPGWTYADDALTKTFEFANFRAAVSFIVRMAFYAEELNHHPELANVYNRVTITLKTHDAGDKVTDLDVQLAQAIEDFVWV